MHETGPSSAGVEAFRGEILDRLLRWTTLLGLIPTVNGIVLSLRYGPAAVAVLDAVAWLALLALTLSRQLPYRTRAVALLVLFWLVGTSLLAALGPFGVGLLWLLSVPAIAGVLLDQRAFWVGEAAIMAVVVVVGATALLGWVDWADRPAPVVWWVMAAFSVLAVSLLVGLSTTAMMARLQVSLQRVEQELVVRERAEREREQLQQQLVVAQKMELVGQLAGGLAHDLNNALTVVELEGELAAAATESPVVQESLDNLLQATASASALCSKLLLFARGRVGHRVPVELDAHLRELEPLLRGLLGERIALELDLRAPGACLTADRVELEQVITNLIANAREAQPDGGTVALTTRLVTGDQGMAIRIEVADQGTGMAPAIRARVFEPFFTTRTAEGSSGLGLTTVYSVISSLDGTIDVESEPGAGARFRILLPGVEGLGRRPPEPPSAWATMPVGTALVVVDDQPTVVQVVRRVFEQLGCTVHGAGSADEALVVLQGLAPRPDLVLTDVVMPGRTGPDLAEEIRDRWPELPVVAMSGWTGDSDLGLRLARLGVPVLAKPFTAEELVATVAERLGRRATA